MMPLEASRVFNLSAPLTVMIFISNFYLSVLFFAKYFVLQFISTSVCPTSYTFIRINSLLKVLVVNSLVKLAYRKANGNMWEFNIRLRMLSKCTMVSSVRESRSSKASLVGAKTVKGPKLQNFKICS